jgi:hypothetical protein
MVKDIKDIDDKWLEANDKISMACFQNQVKYGMNRKEYAEKFTDDHKFDIQDMYLDKTSGYFCVRCKNEQPCRRHNKFMEKLSKPKKIKEQNEEDFGSSGDDFERI